MHDSLIHLRMQPEANAFFKFCMSTGNHYEELIVQMIECATCSRFISEQLWLDLS